MTVTATTTAIAAAGTATGRRGLHRLLIPFGVALTLIIGTLVSWYVAEPDKSDASFLSPAHTGGEASGRLAEALRQRGVSIEQQTTASAAIAAAQRHRGEATVFVPAPEFLRLDQILDLEWLPAGTRVVLVEPSDTQVRYVAASLRQLSRRWATATTSSDGCPLTDAGPAALARSRYGVPDRAPGWLLSCYDGSLVRLYGGNVEFVIAGSADPFRDDRMAEHDNAELAADLLSARPTVIWLTARGVEPKPPRPSADGPAVDVPADGDPAAPPEAGPRPESPFPTWVWALIALLIAVAVAYAVAAGRRLGAALPEPLPIKVSGAETAIGRARLYHRANARGQALSILRADARRRIRQALGSSADNLNVLAHRAGMRPDQVATILYGPEPADDTDLTTAANAVQVLVERLTSHPATIDDPSASDRGELT